MSDITMCRDQECPKKETCHRFTAPVGLLQAYFTETPREGQECRYYWRTETVKSAVQP